MNYLFSYKSLKDSLPHIAYPEALFDCADHMLRLWDDCGLPVIDHMDYGIVKLMYDHYHHRFNKRDDHVRWYFRALGRLTSFKSYNLFWVFSDKTIKQV